MLTRANLCSLGPGGGEKEAGVGVHEAVLLRAPGGGPGGHRHAAWLSPSTEAADFKQVNIANIGILPTPRQSDER